MKCKECGEECKENPEKLCLHCFCVAKNIECSCGCKDASNLVERFC